MNKRPNLLVTSTALTEADSEAIRLAHNIVSDIGDVYDGTLNRAERNGLALARYVLANLGVNSR